MKLKPITENKIGVIKPDEQVSDMTVPITYSQNRFAFHQEIASGKTDDGVKFTVHHSYDRFYVQFDDMLGSIPNLGINAKDLVEAAYKLAKRDGLIKPKRKKK